MTGPTLQWWTMLCGIAALNVTAWLATAATLRRTTAPGDARRLQLLLAAGYVFGCAYRSLLPVYDIQRMSLVDSWLASVIVGRSVATLAELCFVAQWAALLREAARSAGSPAALAVSRLLVPLIAIAELCSWHAVLTTSNLGHVFEESLWGTGAALLAASLWSLRPRVEPRFAALLTFVAAAAFAYVAYMFAVDVPMYWSRWIADEAAGRAYLDVGAGVLDAALRRVVTRSWEIWHTEVVWMTLYFSVGVWVSIALAHVRIPSTRLAPAPARPSLAHRRS